MSFTKMDPLFPGYSEEISNEKLIEIVAFCLRKDFGGHGSTVKTIGQITGANLRTIKNWYDGLKAPSSVHFIELVKASPTLQKWLLAYLFGEGFWEDYRLISTAVREDNTGEKFLSRDAKNSENDVPINVPINLNERQKWFLLKLKDGRNVTAEDVARQFEVNVKTAKRDIADLKKKGKIEFHGSRKTGHYEIIEP